MQSLRSIFSGSTDANAKKKLKDMTEFSREELLTLASRHFFSTYSTCEIDHVWDPAHAMLNELSVTDENFDRKYDEIIIGTVVFARVIAEWHGEFYSNMYDKKLKELLILCGVKNISLMGDTAKCPGMRAMITSLGSKVLDGELSFKAEYLDDDPLAKEHVPMLQRLCVYRPDIVKADEVLTEREKGLLKMVAAQKEKMNSLKNDLASANATIAELRPKAEWHDEEKGRIQAEADAKANKKGLFRNFRRK